VVNNVLHTYCAIVLAGMYNLLKHLVVVVCKKDYNNEIMRWAKSEYKKDWEHAYYMLIQGKQPYSGV